MGPWRPAPVLVVRVCGVRCPLSGFASEFVTTPSLRKERALEGVVTNRAAHQEERRRAGAGAPPKKTEDQECGISDIKR